MPVSSKMLTNDIKEFYDKTKKCVIDRVNDEDNKVQTKYVDESQQMIYRDISLPIYDAACKSDANWKACGLKASNFVYGEVDMFDIYEIIMKHITFDGDDCKRLKFSSLGCGSGPCMAAAYFSNKFREIIGIDLMKAKIRECEYLFALFSKDYYKNHPILAKKIILGDTSGECSNVEHNADSDSSVNNEDESISVTINYGNIVNGYDWSDSNVVYCCATCLTLDVQNYMTETCLKLPKNSYVILIDNDTILSQSTQETSPIFTLINLSSIACTWGACKAYVYKKII